MGSYCLMDMEFQFGKMKKFWSSWLDISVNEHNATEMHI